MIDMKINEIILEALSVMNADNSPGKRNYSYSKLDSEHSNSGISTSSALNWQYNTAPPVAKIQEKRSSRMHGITDKDGVKTKRIGSK